jgi:hypothetical protein
MGLALAPSVDAPTLEFGSCSPAHVAQAVEHFLGKEKVPGSNPGVGSTTLLRLDFAFVSKLLEGAGRLKCGRLVVVYVRHGMRRITGLAIAGTLGALLMGGCSSSSTGQSGSTASCQTSPDTGFGFGAGPAYLSGQSSWYAGGRAAILMVDPKYSGPLAVRASQLGGDGALQITLAAENLDPTALAGLVVKERQQGVMVVSAAQTTEGALELQAVPSSPLWRAWFGQLSTSGPGCFALHLNGTAFTEVIVFAVQAGPAPPG